MTHERPPARWESIAGKMVIGLFLLMVGGAVNQFLNIPAQQQRQDDRLDAIEKHLEYNDKRLDQFAAQHDVMVRQLSDLKAMHEKNP